MKPGPNPQPQAAKESGGNPGKRPINTDATPTNGRPRRPRNMTSGAAKCWKRLIPSLEDLGVLSRTDMNLIVCYCETYERWRSAHDWIRQHGIKYPVFFDNKPPPEGTTRPVKMWKVWPEVAAEQQLRRDLVFMGQQFGMSPSSRSGVTVTKKTDTELDLFTMLTQGTSVRTRSKPADADSSSSQTVSRET